MEETNLKKYGHICALRNDLVIEKCKQTSKKKYGTEIPSQSDSVKRKIFESKKKNHSFGPISKTENIAYLYLSLEYPDTIRQYRDEKETFAKLYDDINIQLGEFEEIKDEVWY